MATYTYYYCPKCGYHSPNPGKCPKCGRTLDAQQEQEQGL